MTITLKWLIEKPADLPMVCLTIGGKVQKGAEISKDAVTITCMNIGIGSLMNMEPGQMTFAYESSYLFIELRC